MNTIEPPKSCVNNLPARNDFKASLFLLCLKKLSWKSLMEKIVQNYESTYLNTSISRRQIVDELFNKSIYKFAESFGNGKSSLSIHNL